MHLSALSSVQNTRGFRLQAEDLLRSYSASAPDTTSMISRVIAACRTLFMYRVRLSIISPEFRVAASIAVICAA